MGLIFCYSLLPRKRRLFQVAAINFTLLYSAGPALRSTESRIPSVDIWRRFVRGVQPTNRFHQMLTPRIREAVFPRPLRLNGVVLN
jgi:hypothetical protein